mgnify:CR=1 FL=1
MIVQVDIPEYLPENGVETKWEDGFIISFERGYSAMMLKANSAGLITLARHLLTLAQADVPAGSHIHYDEPILFERGSQELIIEKHDFN